MVYTVVYCKNRIPRKIKRFKTKHEAKRYMIEKYCRLTGANIDEVLEDMKTLGYSTRGGGCVLPFGAKYTNKWMNDKYKMSIVPVVEPVTGG